MDKLIERINEMNDLNNPAPQSIFLFLREEAETIQDELFELHTQQQQAEDRAWRQMKL